MASISDIKCNLVRRAVMVIMGIITMIPLYIVMVLWIVIKTPFGVYKELYDEFYETFKLTWR